MGRGGGASTEARSQSRGVGKMSTNQQRRGGGGGHYGGRGGGRGRGGYHRGGGTSGGNWNKNKLYDDMSGFLCSCNMNEKDCTKEAFNILNEYVRDEDFQEKPATVANTATSSSVYVEAKTDLAAAKVDSEKMDTDASTSKEEEDDDIEATLKAEIQELKSNAVRQKFFSVDTGVPNLIFIKSTVKDPVALAHRILEDVTAKKVKKSRFLLRLLPIELTCVAKMDQIEATCRKIFPKYFKESFSSFQILYKSRYNNNIDRMEVIKVLADLVCEINPLNVVDLTNPKYSIIVEVIKSVVCIGVVTDFNKLKKYNLHEATLDEHEKKKDSEPKKNEEIGSTADSEEDKIVNIVTEIATASPEAKPGVNIQAE